MQTYIPEESELIAAAAIAERRGLMLLTRINPITRRQQTVIGVRPVGEWKRLNVNAKPVPA